MLSTKNVRTFLLGTLIALMAPTNIMRASNNSSDTTRLYAGALLAGGACSMAWGMYKIVQGASYRHRKEKRVLGDQRPWPDQNKIPSLWEILFMNRQSLLHTYRQHYSSNRELTEPEATEMGKSRILYNIHDESAFPYSALAVGLGAASMAGAAYLHFGTGKR